MENKWKKGFKKAGEITSKVFNKGKDMVAINNHKNHINDCYKNIGELVYESYKNNETTISINTEKIKSILEDIEYRKRKIEELLAQEES